MSYGCQHMNQWNNTRCLGENSLSKEMVKILESLILLIMIVYFSRTWPKVKDTNVTKKEKREWKTTHRY